jgi:hypothetical protein
VSYFIYNYAAEHHYATMLNVVILGVVMLSVIMMNVVILGVVMLRVVAPFQNKYIRFEFTGFYKFQVIFLN